MEEFLTTIKEKMIAEVLKKFQELIRSKFKSSDEFQVFMYYTKEQKLHQDGYGGFIPPQIFDGPFAGGIDECVLSNLNYGLGLRSSFMGRDLPVGFAEVAKLNPLILAEAIRRDADLRLFVRSVIVGAIKRDRNFTSSSERKLLQELLEQLPHDPKLSHECGGLLERILLDL